MTPGETVTMPSGDPAMFLGGTVNGAEFVYLDPAGNPKKHRGIPDTFCLRSMHLLTLLNDQVVNGKRGVYEAN